MCGGTHTDARQPVPTLTCKQLPGRCVQVDEEETLVFVLIDEVESLTAARRAAVAGSEPADAVRAVNAVLTQLDALKRRPNVLVRRPSSLSPSMIGEQELSRVFGLLTLRGPPSCHMSCYDDKLTAKSCMAQQIRASA